MQRRFTRILSTFLLLGFFIIGTTNIVAQNCNTPTNVSTTTISNFSATLNWDADSSVDHYRLRYHEKSEQVHGCITTMCQQEIFIT